MSVTYGAGGSTRERTRDIVIHIQRDAGITAMAHLTCIAHTREQLTSLLDEYREAGIENLLALAGDPPDDPAVEAGDLQYAHELVSLIHEAGDFCIGVAAHPELHPRSNGDRDADRRFLAAKLDMADFGITQFFFEAEPYLRMVDELAALGCTTPVLPGIMPVTNAGQVQRFAQLAGAEFPPALAERFAAIADDPDRRPGARRRGRHRAVRRAAGPRCARPALLHAQPLDRDPRDLRQPRPRRELSRRFLRFARPAIASAGSGEELLLDGDHPAVGTCSQTPRPTERARRSTARLQSGLELRLAPPSPEQPDGHVGHGVVGADGRALVADVDVVGHRDLGPAVGGRRRVGGIADEQALEVEADGAGGRVDRLQLAEPRAVGEGRRLGAAAAPGRVGAVRAEVGSTNGIEPAGGGGPSVVVVVRATVVEVVSGGTASFSADAAAGSSAPCSSMPSP